MCIIILFKSSSEKVYSCIGNLLSNKIEFTRFTINATYLFIARRNILTNDTECLLFISFRTRFFFLIRERIEQYFEYLLTTHLKSPVHISILMMKSNPEYEGQIVNKKVNV